MKQRFSTSFVVLGAVYPAIIRIARVLASTRVARITFPGVLQSIDDIRDRFSKFPSMAFSQLSATNARKIEN